MRDLLAEDVDALSKMLAVKYPDIDVSDERFVKTPGFLGENPTNTELYVTKLLVAWSLENSTQQGAESSTGTIEEEKPQLTSHHLKSVRDAASKEALYQHLKTVTNSDDGESLKELLSKFGKVILSG